MSDNLIGYGFLSYDTSITPAEKMDVLDPTTTQKELYVKGKMEGL